MSDRPKETCRPRFFMEAVQNKAASEKEGRPIFEEFEFVELRQPGDKHWSWIGRVDEQNMHIRERFSEAYAAFKRGEQRAAYGTPLEQWPVLTKARVAELKAAGVLTVEEYSSVPDNLLGKLGMTAREEREQAKAWMASAKGNAATNAMAAELVRLREMVERLTGVAAPVEQPKERSPEDCTDAELKEWLKRETGEAPRGNISRETLLTRVRDLAAAKAA